MVGSILFLSPSWEMDAFEIDFPPVSRPNEEKPPRGAAGLLTGKPKSEPVGATAVKRRCNGRSMPQANQTFLFTKDEGGPVRTISSAIRRNFFSWRNSSDKNDSSLLL